MVSALPGRSDESGGGKNGQFSVKPIIRTGIGIEPSITAPQTDFTRGRAEIFTSLAINIFK
jgi:hypothetical protein